MEITKGQINTVFLTLSEYTTISTPKYLVEFVPKDNREHSFCILGTDLSNFKDRYNKFTITEKSNPVFTSSEIQLDPGEYIYKIYEQSSSSNLNPAGLNCVEEKRCFVKGASVSTTEYTGAENTNTVYA